MGQERKVLHRRWRQREGKAARPRRRGKQAPEPKAEKPPQRAGLTPKQDLFVAHYCANGFNATQAAISAGYSENSASAIGEENLRKPEIARAIAAHQAEQRLKLGITVETLTADLVRLAQRAEDDGQTAAANGSIGLIAKLHGLLAEDRKNARTPLRDLLDKIDEIESGKPRLKVVGGSG